MAGKLGYVPMKCPTCGHDTLDDYHLVKQTTDEFICMYIANGVEVPKEDRDYIFETILKPAGWQTVKSVVMRGNL